MADYATDTAHQVKDANASTHIPVGGHALVIDSGWREVAETALAFIKQYV